MVWDPEHYVHGNYFQNQISKAFCKKLNFKLFGTILDIGSGDGHNSHLLAEPITQGQVLGIDNSEEMVKHANQHWAHEYLSFEVHNIDKFQQRHVFDFALSFWCLHWTNINKSFPNIFHALKNGGRMYAVFSSFSDNSVLQTWHELAKLKRYHHLAERLNCNQHRAYFYRVVHILNQLPFTQLKLSLKPARVYFPNISYFKNFLLAMPFIKTFPIEKTENLIEDMLNVFQNNCQRKYNGRLYYETRPIFLEAIK